MAVLHVSTASYQAIRALADLHDMTPEAYIEAVVAGKVDVEADLETLEVLADPEAMAAIQEHEEAVARGEDDTIPWEQVKADLGL